MSSELRTLGDIPKLHARQQPDAVALRFNDRITTWAQLHALSNRVAHGLAVCEPRPDARIAYLGKNSDHLILVLLGAAKSGHAFLPLNWRLAAPEISHILNDAGARLLFVSVEFLPTIQRLSHEQLDNLTVITVDDGVAGLDRWTLRWDDSSPSVDVQPETPMLQIYTSGTTGRPKGAEISHKALLQGVTSVLRLPEPAYVANGNEAAHIWSPLFHIGGQIFWIIAAVQGATLIITESFEPGQALRIINDFPVPAMSMVPATLQTVLDHPDAATTDFSRVRFVLYGGAPIPPALVRRAMTYTTGRFLHVYGMTECMFISCLLPADHNPSGNQRMMSVGRPYPGVEIRVIDNEGRDLPTDEIGEVTVRAQHLMNGYWKQPGATAQVLDHDGWLRTGDGGYFDDDGYLYLKDRIKDMIISGGENIYPAEIEAVLKSHFTIKDAAVVGVPDNKWGEVSKAYVILQETFELDARVLHAHCAEQLARFKLPKYFEAVTEFPRSSLGKILKGELRARTKK